MELEYSEVVTDEYTDFLKPSCYAIAGFEEYESDTDTGDYENLYAMPG